MRIIIIYCVAYCFNNNDNANDFPYGKLYNWYAATDSRNVCPSGWRVPSDVDWDILNTSIGDEGGNKLKTIGNQYRDLQNNGATNSTGFSGLPGGFRGANSVTPVGSLGLWWTSEKIDGVGVETGIARFLASAGSILDFSEFNKIDGLSIRCMRN